MRTAFGDSFYFLALLSEADESHERAAAFAADFDGRILTTDWVLAELLDALAQPRMRQRCAAFIARLRLRADVIIVRASSRWFDRGFELYTRRRDKAWSLTDCISFVVMTDRRVREALTGDRHFEQAGLVALLM